MRSSHLFAVPVILAGLCASGTVVAQTLDSGPSGIRFVASPTSTPFQQTVTNGVCEMATTCRVSFKPVPAKMRLVITQYNAFAYGNPNTPGFVYSELSGAAGGVVNDFPHTASSGALSFANDQTLAYFDAGQTPTAAVTSQAGLNSIRVTISGTLVRVP